MARLIAHVCKLDTPEVKAFPPTLLPQLPMTLPCLQRKDHPNLSPGGRWDLPADTEKLAEINGLQLHPLIL
jgi:hypothetical protein